MNSTGPGERSSRPSVFSVSIRGSKLKRSKQNSGGRGSRQAANLYRLRWNFALPVIPGHPCFPCPSVVQKTKPFTKPASDETSHIPHKSPARDGDDPPSQAIATSNERPLSNTGRVRLGIPRGINRTTNRNGFNRRSPHPAAWFRCRDRASALRLLIQTALTPKIIGPQVQVSTVVAGTKRFTQWFHGRANQPQSRIRKTPGIPRTKRICRLRDFRGSRRPVILLIPHHRSPGGFGKTLTVRTVAGRRNRSSSRYPKALPIHTTNLWHSRRTVSGWTPSRTRLRTSTRSIGTIPRTALAARTVRSAAPRSRLRVDCRQSRIGARELTSLPLLRHRYPQKRSRWQTPSV